MNEGSTNHYRDAGVDTEKGDALVDWLQSGKSGFIHPSGLGRVAAGIGGFAGLFSLELSRFKKPMLVASTDGVGTKLLLGIESNRCQGLGQDLVAMCVNDLYTVGAVPLFFLDYYATGSLDERQFKEVLSSIRESCQTCGMALLGGETAEMPGLYGASHFDLAGFVVGVVDEERKLGPERVAATDVLVAFKSSGFHSNGYSLVRKWLKEKPRPELMDALMKPTTLYAAVPELMRRHPDTLRALANITGGGISGNLPRVLPDNVQAEINFDSLPIDSWMKNFILSNGVTPREVEEVFNLGAGMIAVVSAEGLGKFMDDAMTLGFEPSTVGSIVQGEGPSCVRYL